MNASRDTTEPGSCSNSTVGLGSLPIQKQNHHPETWTIPHEWNMEKREKYEFWMMDVQSQISNIATQLDDSLRRHPSGEAEGYELGEMQHERMRREREIRSKKRLLYYGLKRE